MKSNFRFEFLMHFYMLVVIEINPICFFQKKLSLFTFRKKLAHCALPHEFFQLAKKSNMLPTEISNNKIYKSVICSTAVLKKVKKKKVLSIN